MTDFADELVDPTATGHPPGFFDRFVINLHPADGRGPSVLLGLGVYPGRRVVDGFVVTVLPDQQRNLRFSTVVDDPGAGRTVGPFAYAVLEPNRIWQVSLSGNPSGVELAGRWEARAPFWAGEIAVANADGAPTAFTHLFQSGRWSGRLSVDGQVVDLDGWWGQRDRSRGVRTMTGGQGLHLWLQAQFAAFSVGLLLVETRSGEPILVEGAVMFEDGRTDDIVGVEHALDFRDLDLRGGRVRVSTAAGEQYVLTLDATTGGGFMAGGGYGGRHGQDQGRNRLDHDVYPLDGTVDQRTLPTSLTDRLTRFGWGRETGSGITEFALTRSRSYLYSPTL